MKKKLYCLAMLCYLIATLLFFTLVPLELLDQSLLSQIESVGLSDAVPASTEGSGDFSDNLEGMGEAYDGLLPWESEDKFLTTIGKYKNIRLIAAYKATLKDPLPGEGENIGLAANKLAGQIIQPGRTFSQNAILGPYTREKGYRSGPTYIGAKVTTTIGGGVCKIASLLYNLAVFSDLQILQRYPHSMTVPYVPPGQDATVYYRVKDIVFKNNTNSVILIWAQKEGNTLYMAFYGFYTPPKVTWHHDTLKTIPTYTIYKRNAKLKQGEQKVVLEGHPGIIVNSWVDVQYSDGSTKTLKRGRSFYSPCPYIVERNK